MPEKIELGQQARSKMKPHRAQGQETLAPSPGPRCARWNAKSSPRCDSTETTEGDNTHGSSRIRFDIIPLGFGSMFGNPSLPPLRSPASPAPQPAPRTPGAGKRNGGRAAANRSTTPLNQSKSAPTAYRSITVPSDDWRGRMHCVLAGTKTGRCSTETGTKLNGSAECRGYT